MISITPVAMGTWWRVPGMPTPDEWQAVWGLLGLIVATVAAFIALIQFGQSIVNQREQSRPMIAVDLHFRSNIITVEVKNVGATAARDIRLAWSAVPAIGDDKVRTAFMRRLVDNPLVFLAPGRSIRFAVGSFPQYPTHGPRHFEVVSNYFGPNAKRKWSSSSVFDLDQWGESLLDADYDNKNWNELRRQTTAMQQSARSTQQAAESLETVSEFLEQQPAMVRLRSQQEREEAEYRAGADHLAGLVFPVPDSESPPPQAQSHELPEGDERGWREQHG
ncbi:hypothetical protein [Curtobacterium flaccumfaciens]|uniref:hypothetical protein n=1 Tax=Curtobacterium flaccumfaciens TaxID=2035 RepID=UPI002175731C|nr:hypothetical protein [Curtobacterium flaccumfaciens]MCS5493266.1 hypothetical protein [Curtobacterium flaccumfaciens pv. flaccumfaciens]